LDGEVVELHARQAEFERGDTQGENNPRAAVQAQAAQVMVLRNQVMGRALGRLQRRNQVECAESRGCDIGVVQRYEANISLSAPDNILGGALLGNTISDWIKRRTRDAVGRWKMGRRIEVMEIQGERIRMIRGVQPLSPGSEPGAAPSSMPYPVYAKMRCDYAAHIKALEARLVKAERERDAEMRKAKRGERLCTLLVQQREAVRQAVGMSADDHARATGLYGVAVDGIWTVMTSPKW